MGISFNAFFFRFLLGPEYLSLRISVYFSVYYLNVPWCLPGLRLSFHCPYPGSLLGTRTLSLSMIRRLKNGAVSYGREIVTSLEPRVY